MPYVESIAKSAGASTAQRERRFLKVPLGPASHCARSGPVCVTRFDHLRRDPGNIQGPDAAHALHRALYKFSAIRAATHGDEHAFRYDGRWLLNRRPRMQLAAQSLFVKECIFSQDER